MVTSKKAVKRLGKALRVDPEDVLLLEQLRDYRARRCMGLTALFGSVAAAIGSVPAIVSCRVKRTESIIRKLRRSQHQDMDFARMDDIVGFRVVTAEFGKQQALTKALLTRFDNPKCHDYVQKPAPSGYRAVHIVIKQEVTLLEGKPPTTFPVEVQLRTVFQNLWASTSESFGEQVKEGGGPEGTRRYLQDLSACLAGRETKAPNEPQGMSRQVPDGLSFYVVEFDRRSGEVIDGLDNLLDFESDLEGALAETLLLEEQHAESYGGVDVVLLGVPAAAADLLVTHVRHFSSLGVPELPPPCCDLPRSARGVAEFGG